MLPVLQGRLSGRGVGGVARERVNRYWPAEGVGSEPFLARFPDREMLCRMAGNAASRRIRYWHPWHMEQTQTDYRLGRRIDWFRSPNGDVEWVDSLVRFTHMVDLAAGYRLAGKGRYLRAFRDYLVSFSGSRGQPGRHWKYPLNSAIRLINLIRAYDLIVRDPLCTEEIHCHVHDNLLHEIDLLVEVVDGTTGNGAFFVATALLIAAQYLRRLYPVDGWEGRAEERLLRAARSEVQPDGVEVEQVPMYHGEAVLTLLDYLVALRANGLPVAPPLRDLTEEMVAALVRMADPEGRIPPIGDSDRFSVDYILGFYGAVVRGERAAGSHLKEAVEDGVAPATAAPRLTVFDETGWAIVRWRYSGDRQGYLLFDCSGKPAPPRGRHSHADDLHLLLHSTAGPILTDPGRFTYCKKFEGDYPFTRRRIYRDGKLRHLIGHLFPRYADLTGRDWRRYFQSTPAHNTVTRNGESQPWYEERDQPGCRVTLNRATTLGPLVVLEGELVGGGSSAGGYETESQPDGGYGHRRRLFGYLPHLWVIVDDLQSNESSEWTSAYHLGDGVSVARGAMPVQFRRGDETYCLGFAVTGSHTVDVEIEDDWVSQIYNSKRPSKTIRAMIRGATDASLVTVLGCSAGGVADMRRLVDVESERARCDDKSDLCCFELFTGEVEIRLVVNPSGGEFGWNGYESDAIFSFVSTTGGSTTAAGFMDGSYLGIRDRRVEAVAGKRYGYAEMGS